MTPAPLELRTGLHPDTWAVCAEIIRQNDPLAEGPDGLRGADLLCVGYRDGEPVGFIAGFSQASDLQPPVAVCSFVRVARVAAGSRVTVRALFEGWADQVRKRGHTLIVAGVPREPRQYRRTVEIMLEAAGFSLYYDGDAERDWFRAAVPPARRPTPQEVA